MTDRHVRQLDIFRPIDSPIHILGAGGIGSWTALLLAKMGCVDLSVYDDDVVEDHNVASQCYKENQLGQEKLVALGDNIKEQSGVEIKTYAIQHENKIRDGLVIIAVDSMEARISINDKLQGKNVHIIDGRMGGLQLEVYVKSIADYHKTLVNPLDVDVEACTARAISFNCSVVAGIIANYVRQYFNGLKDDSIILGFEPLTLLRRK